MTYEQLMKKTTRTWLTAGVGGLIAVLIYSWNSPNLVSRVAIVIVLNAAIASVVEKTAKE